MFTLEQIELAHGKVKSGAEFPKYIQEIKEIGVMAFETWVIDSHTRYFGKNNFQAKSKPKYDELNIVKTSNKDKFNQCCVQPISATFNFCKNTAFGV